MADSAETRLLVELLLDVPSEAAPDDVELSLDRACKAFGMSSSSRPALAILPSCKSEARRLAITASSIPRWMRVVPCCKSLT